ncbi:MAG: (Fe-S)-binding protein [Desulfobacterium sp.]|nr:(Fe-S)-binding protein [Desulfobacterium sp.]MBU3948003.1 (Fe-S)-binding protein [Pseudomonadota bacterium]MBU4035331.1 (Fe-S)-binding protein [Pseudomonadota bacterium]
MKERNVSYTDFFQTLIAYFADGRTLEDQLKDIKKTGNHAPAWMLRAGLLRAIGVPEPKKDAKYFLTFGCYVPFWIPSQVLNMFKILDLLGIEYNYSLEKELCCGAPVLEDSIEFVDIKDEERQKVKEQCKGLMQINWDLGKQTGAKDMVYMCHVCAALVRNTFPEDIDRHRWVWDVIMDKLEEKELEITPREMGYYEGCHRQFPYNSNLDWPRYRKLLGNIKGLTLVDLPNKYCCKQQPDRILEEAEKKNLKAILVPCGDGDFILRQTAQEKIEIVSISGIVMQALGI